MLLKKFKSKFETLLEIQKCEIFHFCISSNVFVLLEKCLRRLEGPRGVVLARKSTKVLLCFFICLGRNQVNMDAVSWVSVLSEK